MGCASSQSAGDGEDSSGAGPAATPSASTGDPGSSSSGPTSADAVDTSGSGESTAGSSSDSSGTRGEAPPQGPPFELTDFFAEHEITSNTWGPGHGWGDLDGDDRLDLVTVGGSAPSRVHLGQGDGTFVPWAFDGPLAALGQTAGVALADYDNDGWTDIYVLRVGANVLLRNDAGRGLVDVTAQADVGDLWYGMSASWGDFDGDGWLDLYVCNTNNHPDALYRAQGDGTFAEVTSLLPGAGFYQAFASVWFDFDDDADPDLYVVNDKNVGNQLWRNDGPGCGGWCFTDISLSSGAVAPACSMGVAVGDYDGDLDLDLSFTDNYEHHLLRNDLEQGQERFVEVAGEAGVHATDAILGWGVMFFDFDNDGWLDLYAADGQYGEEQANLLFHNRADGVFEDVSAACDCADDGISYGVTYADYDEDGALDFAVSNRHVGHFVYRNRRLDPQRHWLTVDLRGGGPVNRDAIGARVWVTTDDGRTQVREVEAGSSVASTNMRRLHFGLGHAVPTRVEIRWPDGLVEVPPVPSPDQRWVHAYPR